MTVALFLRVDCLIVPIYVAKTLYIAELINKNTRYRLLNLRFLAPPWVAETIFDRMYDLGKEGMIQTAFKEKRRIIDILVTE